MEMLNEIITDMNVEDRVQSIKAVISVETAIERNDVIVTDY